MGSAAEASKFQDPTYLSLSPSNSREVLPGSKEVLPDSKEVLLGRKKVLPGSGLHRSRERKRLSSHRNQKWRLNPQKVQRRMPKTAKGWHRRKKWKICERN